MLRTLALRLREGEKEWGRGGFQADTFEKTALVNAEAIGKYAALQGLIEMSYEDYLAYTEETDSDS